jgi:hypothetical protein
VGSQVPPYSHFTLIVLLYLPSLSNTLFGVHSLQALSFWSHATLCTILFCYPREGHLRSRQWLIQLEVLTLMEGVSLSIGTWESSSLPRASNEAIRQRRSSNKAQQKRSHGAQSNSTRGYVTHTQKEKLPRRPRSFTPFTCSVFSDLHDQCILHRFLCSSSFRKSWDKISVKGEGL